MEKISNRNYLLVFFLVVFSAGCCNPKAIESLAVTAHSQETRNWCWAASGQMIMDYLGNNVAQCTQANNRFGRNDCCDIDLCPNPEQNHACVTSGWPEFNKYGFSSTHTTNAALSWSDLKEEISDSSNCGRRPFAFTWKWPGGGGHMMVATGYKTEDGINFVEVSDPWSPCVGDHNFITYDYYVQSPGHHTHWDDYYEVN